MEIAKKIGSKSLPSIMMAKECINISDQTSLNEGLKYESRIFHSMFSTKDQKEGMAAFVEKRKPNWKN